MSRTIRIISALLLLGFSFASASLGGLCIWEYIVPMLKGQYEVAARRVSLGDRASALYNAAWEAHEQGNASAALNNAREAFSALCRDRGTVPEGDRAFAAEIQFLLGNSFVDLQRKDEAIAAYESCLTLMPDHVDARHTEIVRSAQFNLEWLKQPEAGAGSPPPKQDPNQPPTKLGGKGHI